METIVIEVKSAADKKFWLELAKKTGNKAKAINTNEMEDAAMAGLIEKGLKSRTVSRESVFKALR